MGVLDSTRNSGSDCASLVQWSPAPSKEAAVSAREETSAPLFKIIANQFETMALLFEALAEPDRSDGWEQESPEGEVAERPRGVVDIANCLDEGVRAQRACTDAGGKWETCLVTGKLAEADCLRAKLKEPEIKPEK